MASKKAVSTATVADEHDAIEMRPLDGPSTRVSPTVESPVPPKPVNSAPAEQETPPMNITNSWILIIQLCGNNFISCFTAGLMMVCIPVMAADLALPRNLLLWPTAVTSLSSAAFTLLAGSVADTIGRRRMNIAGSLLQSAFIIATGLVGDWKQLIVFRLLSGIANCMFSSSGRALLSTNMKHGPLRNFALSAFVLAFPLGAGLGLVLGGVYADLASWRIGFWSSGILSSLLSLSAIFTLPKDPVRNVFSQQTWDRLQTEIDWIGILLSSASVAILSYVLAILSSDTTNIYEPSNIVMLTIALALIPAFAVWVHYREKRGKTALIPNGLWADHAFTCVCLMIALSNGAQGCLTYFVSLFFQEVQQLSPLDASLRLLPQAVVGVFMCLCVGLFVSKVKPFTSIVSATALCSLSPLLMAITNPDWPYWYTAFWAQVLGPVSIDVMFVVGFLVVSDAFSGKSQARASAVFSTFAALGNSISLCIMSVISNGVINHTAGNGKVTPTTLLQGYRASFWAQFAWIAVSCGIGALGLRKLAHVGTKRD